MALTRVQQTSYQRTSTIYSATILTQVKNAVFQHGQIVYSGDVNQCPQLQALVG